MVSDLGGREFTIGTRVRRWSDRPSVATLGTVSGVDDETITVEWDGGAVDTFPVYNGKVEAVVEADPEAA